MQTRYKLPIDNWSAPVYTILNLRTRGGEIKMNMKDEIIKQFALSNYEEFGKYLIERSTDTKGLPVAKIFNTNVKKLWKAKVEGYYFMSEEAREKHINEFKARIQSITDWKAEKKAKLASFGNPAKVGDILYSSWGYEQTNIDFYQVTEVKGKSIRIRLIGKKETESTGWLQGKVVAVKDRFIGEKEYLKRVRPSGDGYAVNLNDYSSAWLWDGHPCQYTAYA